MVEVKHSGVCVCPDNNFEWSDLWHAGLPSPCLGHRSNFIITRWEIFLFGYGCTLL